MATLVRAVRQKVRHPAYRVRRPEAPRTPVMIRAEVKDAPLPDLSSLILYGQA